MSCLVAYSLFVHETEKASAYRRAELMAATKAKQRHSAAVVMMIHQGTGWQVTTDTLSQDNQSPLWYI